MTEYAGQFTDFSEFQADSSLQGPAAIADFFYTILYYPEEIRSEILTALELNGVFLGNGSFRVTLFRIHNTTATRESDQQHPSSRRLYMALEEITRQKAAFSSINYTLNLAGSVLNIACFPGMEESAIQTTKLLSAVARSVMREFESRYPYCQVLAVVSGTGTGIRSISKLFQQTQGCLEFSAFCGETPRGLLLYHDPDRDLHTDRDFSIFSSFAWQIRRAVQARDSLQLQQIHSNALEYILGTGLPVQQQCLARTGNYINVVMQHLKDADLISMDFVQRADISARILCCSTAAELSACTLQFLEEVFTDAAPSLSSPAGIRISDIRDYIEQNISDPQLSVQKISDYFQMSQAALSLSFKRNCSQNISEYIHLRRLELAKKAMLNSDQPCYRICEAAGYGSVATMYRAFRRYLHMTPGEFRLAEKKRC